MCGHNSETIRKLHFFLHDKNREKSNVPIQYKKKEFLVIVKPLTFTRNTKFHINSLSQIFILI